MLTRTLCTSLLIVLLPQAAQSAANWRACMQLTDDQARLACYDDYAQRLSSSEDPVKSAAQQEADFGKRPGVAGVEAVKSAAQQEAGFGKPPEVAAQELDHIQASISKVQIKRHGKRLLTLDNGQVWVQLDSRTTPRFREGDSIIIKRAAFGSFLLKPVDSNRTIRVKRLP